MNVLISCKCDKYFHRDMYTIENIYSIENQCIPTIVTMESRNIIAYNIILKVKSLNNFNDIKKEDPVFLQTLFY